jgi:RNA polymerase sigma-70 factor (ECF subfamily)
VFLDARAGDPRAFRALIGALAPDLIRFTTYLLKGDRDGAHDVAQDVFVAAWQQLGRLHDVEHLRRWCYRVARYRAGTWRRRLGACGRAPLQLSALPERLTLAPLRAEPPAQPDAVRERASTFAALQLALRRLPLRYGAPVQLHYLQGYDLRETARLLGTSHGSVKMRLVRARAHLRSTLAGMLEPRRPPSARPPGPALRSTSGEARKGGSHAE